MERRTGRDSVEQVIRDLDLVVFRLELPVAQLQDVERERRELRRELERLRDRLYDLTSDV